MPLASLPISTHQTDMLILTGNHFLQLKSSVVMVSNPLGTCTLFSWTLTGSIIITEQSQPRNHHNSYFAWMLSLPASHIRRTFKDENTSHPINPSLPIMAHLRHGAMRNCSSCPIMSDEIIIFSCMYPPILWTHLNYKIGF